MWPLDPQVLAGRTAVVTGAARGFGAAIATALAEAGARTVVADRDEAGAEEHAATLRARGYDAVTAAVDVADPDSVAVMTETLFAAGGVDVLVNNAGVFSNYLVQHLPYEEFDRIMRVNVMGTFLCSQAVVRRWLDAGREGVVVNVASVDALRGSAEGLCHYTTSKHAIAGLTRSFAMELAPRGIRVNAVCPGAAMTEGAVELVTAGAPEGIDVAAQWDGIRDRTPLRRLCEPVDVARAVVYLASDLAGFVTGVLLPVDGGILVQPLEGYVEAAEEQPAQG